MHCIHTTQCELWPVLTSFCWQTLAVIPMHCTVAQHIYILHLVLLYVLCALGMAKLMFMSLRLCGSMYRSGGTVLKGTVLRAAIPCSSGLPNSSTSGSYLCNPQSLLHLCMFWRYDRDGSGKIDSSELHQALTEFGYILWVRGRTHSKALVLLWKNM